MFNNTREVVSRVFKN